MSRRFRRRTFLAGAAAALVAACSGKKRVAPRATEAPATAEPVPSAIPSPTGPLDPPDTRSAAREWDEQILSAIRRDRPRPPIHARNLYHLSAAMWDAWAAYDAKATQLFHHERATAGDVERARAEAISFAAYRLIRDRYAKAVGAEGTLAALDLRFSTLGYEASNTSTSGSSPAALGNRVFETIRAGTVNDGANQAGEYRATNGYVPVNAPLEFVNPGTTMSDPNRWQPLSFPEFVEQNGIPAGVTLQTFVCPHWADVKPFALTRPGASGPYLDPGPPPLLGSPTEARFKAEFTEVIQFSSWLDPSDGELVDVSPAGRHNNALGFDGGGGYVVNPVTGQPYRPLMVNRADYARVLAEFWADGPDSETPPGHWNVIANIVSDSASLKRQLDGRAVNRLEWDVKLYLALNGAVHDAAIAAWGVKGKYDSVRPISAIRYMGGQPEGHAHALPLQPGLIERISVDSARDGGRHSHLAGHIGEIAIRSWNGEPGNPETEVGGAGWILASAWMPYQKGNFVTPPFAGFTSGHSTFSRAAAEVLSGFTGSPYFPGGLQRTLFAQDGFLTFEQGPSMDMELQWATYFDAADEAGLSRRFGGIHIAADDYEGRKAGSAAGKAAFARAVALFAGRDS